MGLGKSNSQVRSKAFALRRKGWSFASIEKELDIKYSSARRLGKEYDLRFGRPVRIVRNPRKTAGQAGIREVRMRLKEYLERVKRGESFEILQRGRAVATLGPLSAENVGKLPSR